MPPRNHHRGRCPRTPGIYRFKTDPKRGENKSAGNPRELPAASSQAIPGAQVASQRCPILRGGKGNITHTVDSKSQNQMCQLFLGLDRRIVSVIEHQ